MKSITFLKMTDADITFAENIAKRRGRHDQNWAYSDTCDMPGLYVNKRNSKDESFVVVKTKEFGFMVMACLEDLGMYDLFASQVA